MNPLSASLFWLVYLAVVAAAAGAWHVIARGYRVRQAERNNPIHALHRIHRPHLAVTTKGTIR